MLRSIAAQRRLLQQPSSHAAMLLSMRARARGAFWPNEANPAPVVSAKAGTHNHGLWLLSAPLRGRRPGRRSLIRTKNQPAAVGNDHGAQLQRVEPPCPGEGRHALDGVGSRGAGSPTQPTTISRRRVSANGARQQDGGYFAQAPPAQPAPCLGHKKSPGGFCPPGVVSSTRHASIKERCRGGRGCEVRSCPDSGARRRPSAWRPGKWTYRSRWRPSMPSPASGRSHRSPHRTTV
jgi:hypothetical protein